MAGERPSRRPGARRRRRIATGRLSRFAIVFLCLALYLFLRVVNPLPVESLRDDAIVRAIDMARFIGASKVVGQASDVVVVDIDEATIANFGRWPLPRLALAQLVDAVKAGHPAAIGLAYVFTNAGHGEEADQALARSFTGGHVVLGTAELKSRQVADDLKSRLARVGFDNLAALDALPRFGRLTSIPGQLMQSGAGAGLLAIQLSHNGVPIRLPTLVRYQNGIIPSLPLEMMRVGMQAPVINVSSGLFGLRGVSIGGRSIRSAPDGMIWFGADKSEAPRRISAMDIMAGKERGDAFRSAYVLIGSTAAGLSSEHVAANGEVLPDLDALAYSLAALLQGKTYYYPAQSFFLEMLLALGLAVVAFFAASVLTLRAFVTAGLGLIAALWGGAVVVIARTGQIVDPGILSGFVALLCGALILNKYRLMRKEAGDVIAEKEREVTTMREDTARVAVAAANPRLSIALSHELRQPLTAASNYLGAIRRLAGREQAEGARNLATYADEASRQISSMSDIMNELAEIVRGDLTLQRENDVRGILIEAVSVTLASKDDPSVRFVADIPDNLAPVLLNRRQIQLVVSNLARNAIEAPRQGKELTLVLRVRPLGHEWVEVSLADNAAGIPESIQERLFSRFETSKSKGSGIGLPLCRDIVEAHGGEIWFESAPGKGTTFFFTLRKAH